MGDWTWVASSRVGAAHLAAGECRQDAYRIVSPADARGHLVVVACDGAGSTSHGGAGAALAAWSVASSARVWLGNGGGLPGQDRLSSWFLLARLRIAAAAQKRGLELNDFATTVVAALTDGESVLTAHVGDGAIVARESSKERWTAFSWPEHGEYASTTRFITDPGEVALRIGLHDTPIDRIAVLTDGLERLALDFAAGVPHDPFFDAMSAPVAASECAGLDRVLSAQLNDYLGSERVLSRTDDDKTLVVAARA